MRRPRKLVAVALFAAAAMLGAPPASASAPASRCGVDQRPSLARQGAASDAADGEADRPAGPAYRAELARMHATLSASSDAFDNAVADWMNVAEADAPTTPVAAIAHRALASSDARVYALAYRACHADDWRAEPDAPTADASDCAALGARRWSELDPGNGVPWMYVFTQASAAGDRGAQDEAMAKMASAARFDDRVNDAGDANRAQQCEAIGALMFDHGDNLLLQAMGGAVVLRATGDATRRDKGRAERMAMSRAWSPATGLSDCGVVRDGLKTVLRNAQVGELAAARERLTATNMP